MGGAERVAETLATGLVVRGHEVAFEPVAGVRDRAVADHMRGNLVARGVTVRAAASASNAKLALPEATLRLDRTVERFRPDLVHLHTEIPEFAWAMAGLGSRRTRRVTVVRTIHNTVLWGGWARAGRFTEGRLESARVAAVSEAARDAFAGWRATVKRAPAEAVVIYNGVDMAALADGPGTPNDPPVLCFAGRFEPQKGIDVLLDSLARLMDGEQRFRVEIHGDGTLAEDVARAAQRWPDRVTVGPPMADLRSRLDTFDAILMPSRFEGMPLLAVEALSTGTPLLATDAPGLGEVLPVGYPGRCPPGDAAAYAAVIRDFLDDRAAWREKAIAARTETRSRFSLEAMLDSYEQLYAEAIR
jgi:glycosyltransferase involved in cell wall biosynthesis